MPESTVGERIFEIRAARGGGPRKPMSLRDFADLLTAEAPHAGLPGRRFHASQISGWETGGSLPSIEDVKVLARVDPKQRGRSWLAFGDASAPDRGERFEADMEAARGEREARAAADAEGEGRTRGKSA